MPIIRVLRPFMFSHPVRQGQRVGGETLFKAGDHVISDEMAKHEWIKSGADGHIETPEQAVARLKVEADKAALLAEDAARANAHAQAAMARLKAADDVRVNKGTQEEIEAELNTPVNILQGKRAGTVEAPVNAAGGVQAGQVDPPAKVATGKK